MEDDLISAERLRGILARSKKWIERHQNDPDFPKPVDAIQQDLLQYVRVDLDDSYHRRYWRSEAIAYYHKLHRRDA